jgi:hypothetical protein
MNEYLKALETYHATNNLNTAIATNNSRMNPIQNNTIVTKTN